MTGTAAQRFAEYRGYDSMGLAKLVRRGEADPTELLDIAIARIEAVNPQLNFMAVQLYDRARAAISAGLPAGPFTGVPFLLKDLSIHLAGELITNGSRLFRGQRSAYSSTLAERYEAAGLLIFGRTTSPELGATTTTESTLYGKTRNPWGLEFSTGGSSGGAAAAVASGVLPCAHASDGGGSIRIPASCCGLFGLKPSRGRVPYGPVNMEGSGGLSAMHVVSRSVRDSAALLDISRGPEAGAPYVATPPARPYLQELTRTPDKLRLGVLRQNGFGIPLHPDCEAALEDAEQLCRSLGHETRDVTWPADVSGREAGESMGVLMGTGSLTQVLEREAQLGRKVAPNELEPINYARIRSMRGVDAATYSRARLNLMRLSRRFEMHFSDYDMVLSPTMAAPPPKLGLVALTRDFEQFSRDVLAYATFTGIFNITGQPAMSVPLYWNSEQLPIGVMFSAKANREDLLFQLAAQLERARSWFDRLPPELS